MGLYALILQTRDLGVRRAWRCAVLMCVNGIDLAALAYQVYDRVQRHVTWVCAVPPMCSTGNYPDGL